MPWLWVQNLCQPLGGRLREGRPLQVPLLRVIPFIIELPGVGRSPGDEQPPRVGPRAAHGRQPIPVALARSARLSDAPSQSDRRVSHLHHPPYQSTSYKVLQSLTNVRMFSACCSCPPALSRGAPPQRTSLCAQPWKHTCTRAHNRPFLWWSTKPVRKKIGGK